MVKFSKGQRVAYRNGPIISRHGERGTVDHVDAKGWVHVQFDGEFWVTQCASVFLVTLADVGGWTAPPVSCSLDPDGTLTVPDKYKMPAWVEQTYPRIVTMGGVTLKNRNGEFPSIWAIYDHPKDFPDKFIARRWVGLEATQDIVAGDTLEDVRRILRDERGCSGFLDRAETDDPKIVETWL